MFVYPDTAKFGRVLPKNKIYEHGRPSTAVKNMFVRQVEQIVWQYKLSSETVNVRPSRAVTEIQLFRITLKNGELKKDVLRCIDRAIPYPILFELCFNEKIQVVGAYKRPSEADSAKWVVGDYFETSWLSDDIPRTPLPVVLNLEALYAGLLRPLMPYPARAGERLKTYVERMEKILARQREMEKVTTQLKKEKQFNRKVEINQKSRTLTKEIEKLTKVEA